MRRWPRYGSNVASAGLDRSHRCIRAIDRRWKSRSRDDRNAIAAYCDDRTADRSSKDASRDDRNAIDRQRSMRNFFSNRLYDLLTRDDPHAIDSADMIARIFDCDHPNRCPTQFDLLFRAKGKRSPFIFLSSQTQSVDQSAVTSCNSLR